jgi:hypothetical protein
MDLSPELFQFLNKLVEQTKDRSVVFAALDIQVQKGEMHDTNKAEVQ